MWYKLMRKKRRSNHPKSYVFFLTILTKIKYQRVLKLITSIILQKKHICVSILSIKCQYKNHANVAHRSDYLYIVPMFFLIYHVCSLLVLQSSNRRCGGQWCRLHFLHTLQLLYIVEKCSPHFSGTSIATFLYYVSLPML